MENREREIQACRGELAELRRRADILEMRLDAMSGKQTAAIPEPMEAPMPVEVPMPEKRENLESAVGRNLFAVLASVLVLIGVGVFISTIYEQIPQIIKIITIYVFGFVLLGAGLVIFRKNANKFWLGVGSCGLAELLVSIITSHSYFGVLPLLPTFALVLVWILGSFWLTRFHPTVFKTIGFIGFLISISLGLTLVAWNEIGIYLTLLGAYVVLSMFFMVTNKSYVNMNTAMGFFSAAGLMMFYQLDVRLPEELYWLSGVLIMGILAVFHGAYVWKARLHRDAYPIYAFLTVLMAAFFLLRYEPVVWTPVVGTMAFVLWVIQVRWGSKNPMRHCYTALIGVFFAGMVILRVIDLELLWWIAAFAGIAYGLYWWTKARDMAWFGWLCFLLFYIRSWMIGEWVFWPQFLGAVAMFLLSDSKWLRRDRALQTAWYVLMLACAHRLWGVLWFPVKEGMDFREMRISFEIRDAIFHTVMAAVNVWYLHRSLADKEKLLRINGSALVVMALQAYAFCQCMIAVDSEIWYVTALGILGSMAVLSYSLWYTLKTRGVSRKLMVWQFVKFTLYCWAVLALLDSSNILMHISLLLIAIAAVVVGFRLGHKAVRVYGLVLSLVDVVSLVLFNIDYGNSIQLAGGIVLCGVLCFVISFIYSRLSKVF